MKIINHTDGISYLVEAGRVVQYTGLATMAKGIRFNGKNVKVGANVSKGSEVGYNIIEENGVTTLVLRHHRPGKVYEISYSVNMPMEDAVRYWELSELYHSCHSIVDGPHLAED